MGHICNYCLVFLFLYGHDNSIKGLVTFHSTKWDVLAVVVVLDYWWISEGYLRLAVRMGEEDEGKIGMGFLGITTTAVKGTDGLAE